MEIMDIKSQLANDLKDAMRSGDEVRKRTVRMALSAIKLSEIDTGGPLDQSTQMAVIQKEVKSRNESIDDAQRAGRPDLITAAQAEIAVLEGYLPKPFTPEEMEALVRQAITEAGASSPAEMGKVMKLLTPRLLGRATGAQVSQVVRQLLQ
jgi:uncharacterized protein YqeY